MYHYQTDKTLEQRKCTVFFRRNHVFNAWNGYLTRDDGKTTRTYTNGVPNNIKCFVENTREECIAAATLWANNHRHSLKNYQA